MGTGDSLYSLKMPRMPEPSRIKLQFTCMGLVVTLCCIFVSTHGHICSTNDPGKIAVHVSIFTSHEECDI